jgi:hypothetical protein
MEQNAGHNVPDWLEWNPRSSPRRSTPLPTPEDVPPSSVNLNLIIRAFTGNNPTSRKKRLLSAKRKNHFSARAT